MRLEMIVSALAHELRMRRWQMASAESCTGGLIAGACTQAAGASEWFERGFVTYSNASKNELLGVPLHLIDEQGAVSEAVARAMAAGALAHSRAQVSVAVTGIAGPGGGSLAKPVGTVWFGWQVGNASFAQRCYFSGGRLAVREATVAHALQGLLERVRQQEA